MLNELVPCLTFHSIATYTSQLPSATVNHLISSALKVWSDVSPLTFIPSSTGKADIMIRFARRAHGDSQPFDGPGGTVAHAFGPGVGIGGDAHFDGDEKWSAEHNGINLYLVAAHEFGHSLGLPHSRNPASLMYPTYQKRRLQGSPLSFEDVHRIQTLYGMDIYIRLHMSCIQIMLHCQYLLKMWIKDLSTSEVKEGFIKNFLSQIKANISAAYEVSSKKTMYIFQATFLHSYLYLSYDESTHTMDKDYPKNISYAFPGISGKVDAAFEMTGFLHFVIDSKSYKYDYKSHIIVDVIDVGTWLGC
ncbi:PREDICTED: matrix metalloproteinase-20-like [Gavialis gangeticus]|uniref:matrix metalloproteinase-20-like n=1 Tax=Gavialis gangeticus TaxID=94835 RepID=UPI00092F2132|nr:PREDICTED: matrix metalloproteinase-20-like [Gavialis gangeticus]